MAEFEFALVQYDFNSGGAGDQEPQASQMRLMTKTGWEIENSSVAHPYLAVLWRRPYGETGSAGEPAADLKQELADAEQRASEAETRANTLEQEKQGLQQSVEAQTRNAQAQLTRAERAEARVKQLEEEARNAAQRDSGSPAG